MPLPQRVCAPRAPADAPLIQRPANRRLGPARQLSDLTQRESLLVLLHRKRDQRLTLLRRLTDTGGPHEPGIDRQRRS